jgi:hypothetical protein
MLSCGVPFVLAANPIRCRNYFVACAPVCAVNRSASDIGARLGAVQRHQLALLRVLVLVFSGRIEGRIRPKRRHRGLDWILPSILVTTGRPACHHRTELFLLSKNVFSLEREAK